MEFTDYIMRFRDEGNNCISVFIGLTKAFDTVDHDILLHKLEKYGLRGHANMFFRTYLNNRLQYTTIDEASSTLSQVRCGVPQGSVLGPRLFALYSYDVQYAVGAEGVQLFAGGTALYMVNSDLQTLLSALKESIINLYKWCICRKLTINSEKTLFHALHTVSHPIPNNLTAIVTTQVSVKQVAGIKYLGLVLDE